MSDILSLLSVLHPHLSATLLRQFCQVVFGLLAMTGRGSMRNIARWTSKGGSYRTIQRFLNTVLPWGTLCWVFFRTHLFNPESVYLLAGDETVVSNQGIQLMVCPDSSLRCMAKRSPVWRFSLCPWSVSSTVVLTRCLWSKSSSRRPHQILVLKLPTAKRRCRNASEGARREVGTETRRRCDSATR